MFDLASYGNGIGLVMLGFIVGLVIGFIFKVISKIGYLSIFFALLMAGTSSAAVVNGYSITSGTYGAGPSAWTFSGSVDGVSWNVLDTRSGVSIRPSSQIDTYSFTNTSDNQYYKFNVTSTYGTQYWNITELKLLNNGVQVNTCMTSETTPTPNIVSSSSNWSTSQGIVQAFDCSNAEYVSGSAQLSGWLVYNFGVAASNTAAANNVLLRADIEQGISLFAGSLTAIAFVLAFATARYL